MALVKLNPPVGAINGSVGAFSYTHTPAGQVLRVKASPGNPNTTAQQQVRHAVAQAVTAWRGLTDSARQAWDDYAAALGSKSNAIGLQTKLTGFNRFVAQASLLLRLGKSPVTAAPLEGRPAQPVLSLSSSTPSEQSYILAFGAADPWRTQANAYCILFHSRIEPHTHNSRATPLLLASCATGGQTPPTEDISLTSRDPFTIGNVIFIRALIVDNQGRVSHPANYRFVL